FAATAAARRQNDGQQRYGKSQSGSHDQRRFLLLTSEVELRAKREAVLGCPRSAWIAVEHRSFEIQCVPNVSSRVPTEPHSIAFGFAARPGRRETEREGAVVDLQRVVPRGNL